jgi:hypothetical protein
MKIDPASLETPREIEGISYRARAAVDNMARTLPVPSRAGSRLVTTLFNYAAIPRKDVVYPPDYRIVIDPTSGEIVEHGKVYRRALGIADAPEGAAPADYPRPPGADYWVKWDRLAAISPSLWALWANGDALGAGERALAAEYAALFDEVIQRPLVPYYHAAARDFFAWIAREARGVGG